MILARSNPSYRYFRRRSLSFTASAESIERKKKNKSLFETVSTFLNHFNLEKYANTLSSLQFFAVYV